METALDKAIPNIVEILKSGKLTQKYSKGKFTLALENILAEKSGYTYATVMGAGSFKGLTKPSLKIVEIEFTTLWAVLTRNIEDDKLFKRIRAQGYDFEESIKHGVLKYWGRPSEMNSAVALELVKAGYVKEVMNEE